MSRKKLGVKFDKNNPSHRGIIPQLIDVNSGKFYPKDHYKASKSCPNQDFSINLLPGEIFYQVYWKPGRPLLGYFLSNYGRVIVSLDSSTRPAKFLRYQFHGLSNVFVSVFRSSIPEESYQKSNHTCINLQLSRLMKYTLMNVDDVLTDEIKDLDLREETKSFLIRGCYVKPIVKLDPSTLTIIPVDNFKLVPASTNHLWSNKDLEVFDSEYIFDRNLNKMFELYQKYEMNPKFETQDLNLAPIKGEKWSFIVYKGEVICKLLFSNYGRVINFRNTSRAFLMKWYFDKDGYPNVTVKHKGKPLKISVHLLVATEIFLPLKENLPSELKGYPFTINDFFHLRQFVIIHHKDNVKTNAHFLNLEYTNIEINNKYKLIV